MEAIIYVIIFIMGAMFGSFYTLATYRIPRKEDITHTRSYCPKCNHKLGFFDMFPILSFLLLGGKCRYCKNKISPRYLILEVFSGLIFVSLFYLMGIDIYNIDYSLLIKFGFMSLFISFLFITAWIDIENKKIEKSVLIYASIISALYIVYLCIVDKANIYRYVIYSIIYVLVMLFYLLLFKKNEKYNYYIGLILTLITMLIFTNELTAFYTLCVSISMIILYIILEKIRNNLNKKEIIEKKQNSKIAFAFFMCVGNIISIFSLLLQR